ncbi:MAG: hypothetical protein QM733_15635 [Ilumatobacteraceae bacterium]
MQQSRRLDAVRLHLDGDVEPVAIAADDAVDLDDALRTFEPGFDDLRDEVAAESDEPAEAEPEAPVVVAAADDEEKPPRLAVSLIAGASAADDEEAAVGEEQADVVVEPSEEPDEPEREEPDSVRSAHG